MHDIEFIKAGLIFLLAGAILFIVSNVGMGDETFAHTMAWAAGLSCFTGLISMGMWVSLDINIRIRQSGGGEKKDH